MTLKWTVKTIIYILHFCSKEELYYNQNPHNVVMRTAVFLQQSCSAEFMDGQMTPCNLSLLAKKILGKECLPRVCQLSCSLVARRNAATCNLVLHIWSHNVVHFQCWKHLWAFWLFLLLCTEYIAQGKNCFAQSCVQSFVICFWV